MTMFFSLFLQSSDTEVALQGSLYHQALAIDKSHRHFVYWYPGSTLYELQNLFIEHISFFWRQGIARSSWQKRSRVLSFTGVQQKVPIPFLQMGKEQKSCVHSNTRQLKEPEYPPLPQQVHATCFFIMGKNGWSLGCGCLNMLQVYKACRNAFEISPVWLSKSKSARPSVHLVEFFLWGFQLLKHFQMSVGPIGNKKYYRCKRCNGQFCKTSDIQYCQKIQLNVYAFQTRPSFIYNGFQQLCLQNVESRTLSLG